MQRVTEAHGSALDTALPRFFESGANRSLQSKGCHIQPFSSFVFHVPRFQYRSRRLALLGLPLVSGRLSRRLTLLLCLQFSQLLPCLIIHTRRGQLQLLELSLCAPRALTWLGWHMGDRSFRHAVTKVAASSKNLPRLAAALSIRLEPTQDWSVQTQWTSMTD